MEPSDPDKIQLLDRLGQNLMSMKARDLAKRVAESIHEDGLRD